MNDKTRDALLHLLSIRKFISIAVTVVFCYMSIAGLIDSHDFVTVFGMVVAFYFGRSTALDDPRNTSNGKEDE